MQQGPVPSHDLLENSLSPPGSAAFFSIHLFVVYLILCWTQSQERNNDNKYGEDKTV